MSFATSSPRAVRPQAALRRGQHARPLAFTATFPRRTEGIASSMPLAGYIDAEGRARELVVLPASAGSVLVLDRDAATLRDRRLVAHLAADEPRENAVLVCRHYLDDERGQWCRRVRREDLETVPFSKGVPVESPQETQVVDSRGNAYRLRLLEQGRSSSQLRWCRRRPGAECATWEKVGLREVVAALESYEPMRTLTECAIARYSDDPDVLLTRLRSEFERLCASPIVLNRRLREAVLHAIDRRGTSMSEIALRCGIVKRDRRGKASGETSWLARRVGLMPEGGEKDITPWVHSDVLAAIARRGLGVSPREVELQ